MIAPGSELSIARQARLLGVSRSSVDYRPKPESTEELDLLKRLDELFEFNSSLAPLIDFSSIPTSTPATSATVSA